ncbi:MAG TPA: hypothetical protein DIW47_08865 [Bacteroidetes bacterium]|nr:hypothetical protein [Bacteroidota bacterium]
MSQEYSIEVSIQSVHKKGEPAQIRTLLINDDLLRPSLLHPNEGGFLLDSIITIENRDYKVVNFLVLHTWPSLQIKILVEEHP